MAEINLGSDPKVDNGAINAKIFSPSQEQQNVKKENEFKSESMSSEELNDPNKISVTIADASTP